MKATNKQISKIWVLAKHAEMESDLLHDLVLGITNSESIAALDTIQAGMVIRHLERISHPDKSRRSTQQDPGRLTEAQKNKIFKLMYLLNWKKHQVDGLMKKMTDIDRMEWLTRWQAYDIIEAMRAMLKRRSKDGRYPEISAGCKQD